MSSLSYHYNNLHVIELYLKITIHYIYIFINYIFIFIKITLDLKSVISLVT